MKKYYLLFAVLGMAAQFANAQSVGIDNEVDAELEQVYKSPAGGSTQASPHVAPGGAVIINQATSSTSQNAQAMQVQKQPTTYIEASPLVESRADQIKKARQETEAQTESRIVEKLEQSRMEDEKKRAAVLFGDSFNQLQNGQQQPVQQMAPAPVVVAPAQDNGKIQDLVREEIHAALDKDSDKEVPSVVESKYFGGVAGIGDYPNTKNVRGNYALGVTFGSVKNNFVVEGTFLASSYSLEKVDGYYPNYYYYYPRLIDVNQYSGALAAKYQIFSGMVKPVFGALVQYSYRSYEWSQDSSGYNYYNDSTANTHAVDLGVIAGMDVEFNPDFTVGLDFRYLFNMFNRVSGGNNSILYSGTQYGTPLEKINYYVLSLVGKVSF